MTTYQTFIARGKPAPVIVHHSVDIAFQQLKELRVLRANLPPSPIYISDGDDSAPAATVKKLPPIVLVASKTTHCEYCKAHYTGKSYSKHVMTAKHLRTKAFIIRKFGEIQVDIDLDVRFSKPPRTQPRTRGRRPPTSRSPLRPTSDSSTPPDVKSPSDQGLEQETTPEPYSPHIETPNAAQGDNISGFFADPFVSYIDYNSVNPMDVDQHAGDIPEPFGSITDSATWETEVLEYQEFMKTYTLTVDDTVPEGFDISLFFLE